MFRKVLLLAALVGVPAMTAQEVQADHCYGYRPAYRSYAPAYRSYAPAYRAYRPSYSVYRPAYRAYRPSYRYARPYGYGRSGVSISIGTGGFGPGFGPGFGRGFYGSPYRGFGGPGFGGFGPGLRIGF